MSNKSSSSNQIISLPKGGGAQKGLGEKFSPDLFTGTGNFTVPIALPPGRNGFQPELSLVYSTGNGNGPFGLGWGLSIPGVSRKTSKGIPQYDDEKDVFILSGAEDLVPVEKSQTETRYQPRTEGLFARIIHHHNAQTHDDYWEVRSKDGLVSLYGTPAGAGNDPAVIADPDNRSHVFAWKLSCTTDPFGNRIEYSYERDAVQTDGPHHWDQLYLSRIKYVDYEDNNGATKFLVSVHFLYEDAELPYEDAQRPDPFSEYRAGFEIRTTKRCKSIKIYTHPGQDRLVRTYEFIYLNQTNGNPLPLNQVSLLSQIKVIGHDGNATEELPPLEFGYTRFEPELRKFSPLNGHLPAQSLANPEVELVDLFGNGMPDILEMNGTVRYWRNRGGGNFDLPRAMQAAPAGLHLADKGVQLIDADGDGRTDLLVTKESLSGYYPLRFGGLWDRRSFQKYPQSPSFDLEDPEVRLVDLDGDGVTDAIRSGTSMECYFNNPEKGWYKTQLIARRSLEDFPNINFSDERVKWADMSGDGMQDIVLVHNGNMAYWPNLGRGNWGKKISMRNCPRFPYGYDPKRILIGDVDGDGLADVVYVDNTKVTLWINQNGDGWSDPIEIQGTPPVSDMDAVRLVDLLGSSISGILWTKDATIHGQEHYYFLDFTGGVKPYLLSEMNNHMGAVTLAEYKPSTHFYLQDEQPGKTHWRTPLPFPVQVVARVEVIDEISRGKLTTEYRYHHGYWDGAEREFRGFGIVEQLDTEDFDAYNNTGLHGVRAAFKSVNDREQFSPPTLTKTWFHQGPVGDEFGEWEETDFSSEYWAGDQQVLVRLQEMTDFLKGLSRRVKRDALRTLRGRILRTELYARDGSDRQDRPYTISESLHGVTSLPIGTPWPNQPEEWQKQVFFPHALAQRTTQWERGDDPMTQFAFTDDYDIYGQPKTQINAAVPRRRDFRVEVAAAQEPYLATLTQTVFAQRNDNQYYIVDRVARTTSYEVPNDGTTKLFDLVENIKNGTATRHLIGQAVNFYDGMEFQGLGFGEICQHGALIRTETLILTNEIIEKAYDNQKPSLLQPVNQVNWPAAYPQEFRDLLPAKQVLDATRPGFTLTSAGYGYTDPNEVYAGGYYVATERRRYDFHKDPNGKGKGLLETTRDPLGHDAMIGYDSYRLLPTQVTDPAGLQTQAEYDYRVLQPQLVTDPNGNRSAFAFTPLGLLEKTAVMGKSTEQVGDTLESPGTQLNYNFLNTPISVRTIRRIHHVNDTNVPQPQRDETIETIEYSDGFGRLLQTRTQAEDVTFGDSVFGNEVLSADQADTPGDAVGRLPQQNDTNVVVSGWQIYNNKGWVVEKYEPFFSTGWNYAEPTDAQRGQKAKLFYDPRGQVIRTVNPDGSEQRVIYGIPENLDNPENFAPTPWEVYTYDANDNARRTHPIDAQSYQHHWNTPASAEVDALGRTIRTVERNRRYLRNGNWSDIENYPTHSTYDIRGNLLTVADALGRLNFTYLYDLANKPLRTENIDAGVRQIILDAAGNEIERRDSKGSLLLQSYDALNRLIRLWARDQTGEQITLRQHLIYGDNLNRNVTRADNLLGKLFQHYDEAGLLTLERYDFKGNILEKTRRVISDQEILSVFKVAPIVTYRVDWQPAAGTSLSDLSQKLLDATEYRTSITYDALNRMKTLQYPQDVENQRKLLKPQYNRAGALEKVEMDGTPYVEHIAYNAKGQRTLIAYGNKIMTRYAYDNKTFRLMRLRTERYGKLSGTTYHPTAPAQPLQELGYTYDLTGNILNITDLTPGSGVQDNPEVGLISDPQLRTLAARGDALLRRFAYDPLNRLVSASGRECKDIPSPRPWTDDPRCGYNSGNHGTPNQDNAPQMTTIYREEYSYDPAGNMLTMGHYNNGHSWTRHFGMGGLKPDEWQSAWQTHLGKEWPPDAPGNKLTHVGDNSPTTPQTHFFDANGNLVQENGARHFEWDHSDHLRAFCNQTAGSTPSVYVHYLYDAAGQRVKKLVRKQNGDYEATVYVDGIFEHHCWQLGRATGENSQLHVTDNRQRIGLIRVGAAYRDDRGPAVQFHLGDHLGSSSVVVDNDGNWINCEEFTPYGETSLGSFAKKRYRFTGKERDEESDLYYFGARYYASWNAKWTNCDPWGMSDGPNLYCYTQNAPINKIDRLGTQSTVDIGADPEIQATINELNQSDLKVNLEDPQVHATESDVPKSYSERRIEANKKQSTYRKEFGMGDSKVQVGHVLSVKDAAASNISSEIANADENLQQLHSKKGEGLDVEITDQQGNKKTYNRHGAQHQVQKDLVNETKMASGGQLTPQGHNEAGKQLKNVFENTPLDQRNVDFVRGNLPPEPKKLPTEVVEQGIKRGGKTLNALKIIPYLGIIPGYVSLQINLWNLRYEDAVLDVIGFVPYWGDMIDLWRLADDDSPDREKLDSTCPILLYNICQPEYYRQGGSI